MFNEAFTGVTDDHTQGSVRYENLPAAKGTTTCAARAFVLYFSRSAQEVSASVESRSDKRGGAVSFQLCLPPYSRCSSS
jgi:hypothetical protein